MSEQLLLDSFQVTAVLAEDKLPDRECSLMPVVKGQVMTHCTSLSMVNLRAKFATMQPSD